MKKLGKMIAPLLVLFILLLAGCGKDKWEASTEEKLDGSGGAGLAVEMLFDPEYYNDDDFTQLNTEIFVDPAMYKDPKFNRTNWLDERGDKRKEVTYAQWVSDWENEYKDSRISADLSYVGDLDNIDFSHIATAYVAPVLEDGTSYMNIYDYTYAFTDMEQTRYFVKNVRPFESCFADSGEYSELVNVWNTYAGTGLDVSTYAAHYITDIAIEYFGEYLFDADYYMKTYPCLARLYEHDKEALAQHFFTIGMYEGRQGCEDFNVYVYFSSGDSADIDRLDVQKKQNLAKYYYQYALDRYLGKTNKIYRGMLNSSRQHRLYDPVFDADIEIVNYVRTQIEGVNEIKRMSAYEQGEANALCSCRARMDALDPRAIAHELFDPFYYGVVAKLCEGGNYAYGENKYTTTHTRSIKKGHNDWRWKDVSDVDYPFMLNGRLSIYESIGAFGWFWSLEHYNAMVSEHSRSLAQSHFYIGVPTEESVDIKQYAHGNEYGIQFNFFFTDVTPFAY